MKHNKYYPLVPILILAGLLASACEASPVKEAAPVENQTPVEPLVNATGVVLPVQWSSLSVLTSGLVEKVLVEEGQAVEPGQVLVILQGQDTLEAAVAAADLEVESARQALEDVIDNAVQSAAATQLRLANAAKALDKAKDRRDSKNYKRADQSLIDSAKADVVMARDEFKRAQDVWYYYQDKDEEDVNRAYALAQYSAAKKKQDQAIWNLNYLESMPDQLEVNVSEGELSAAKAEMDAAQRQWERVKNGPDARQVSLAQARLASAQANLKSARKALDNLQLKAPFAGTVSKLYVHQQEWVNPGQPVLILADLKHLQVETTDLNEIDAARINLNDLADVTFDALPDVKIMGKVARIATRSTEGAGVTYPVVIVLAEQPAKIRWGMTAFVDIKIKP